MRVVLNEQRLDDDSLVTFVYKAEAILNGRPQTEVSDDPRDRKALTNNLFLFQRSGPTLSPGVFSKGDCYPRGKCPKIGGLL